MILRHPSESASGWAAPSGDWAYCGRDGRGLPPCADALGPSWKREDLGTELQTAADALRRPFVEWVDGLSRRHAGRPEWWSTQLAERNPLADPFFFHLCCLRAFAARAEAGRLPDLVVCEDWGMLAALARMLRSRGVPVSGPSALGLTLHRAAQLGKLLLRSLIFLRGAFAAALRRTPEIPAASRPRVLVSTFMHERLFEGDGRFSDLYFGDLHPWLERQGFEVWLLPTASDPVRLPPDSLDRLRKSGGRFILLRDWLTAADHLAALRGAWQSLFMPRRVPRLEGLDAAPLVGEQHWNQARSLESFEARLGHLLPSRLAEAGFHPQLVLSWFENHRFEKCLAMGLRRAGLGCRHVGFLCFPPNPNYLTAFPTTAEVEAGVLPDRIVSCGRHQETLLRLFGATVETRVGAALRYAYLWQDPGPQPAAVANAVLIPLPSRLTESVELVALVGELIRKGSAARSWWVKPHPDYTLADLKAAVGTAHWPAQLEVRTESLRELLRRCTVLLSAASGALVEAACAGIPVVIVGRQGDLEFNPLAWFPEFAPPCHDSVEVFQRLQDALRLDDVQRDGLRERGRRLRQECFEPVNETTLRPFLGDDRPVQIPEGATP